MPKRKLHEFINNIEHKHCGKCNQWKPLDQFGRNKQTKDGFSCYCSMCDHYRRTERFKLILRERIKARQIAPEGFSVCLHSRCPITNPKEWLQEKEKFINSRVHTHTLTKKCLTCRARKISSTNRSVVLQECKRVWDEWRKTHACVECRKDQTHNYLVIEADHLPEYEKVKHCSEFSYWATKSRGVPALLTELKKCQALCRFHHHLQTQQRNNENRRNRRQASILKKREIINKEKHKRGSCLTCKRVVKKGEECAFIFDHRDPTTKFICNGKPIAPSAFVRLSQALFDKQWPLEQAKCNLLCANCDKLKTFANRDGYKK